MPKIYPFLVALSWLLLAGCGHERTRQEREHTRRQNADTVPTLADTVLRHTSRPVVMPPSALANPAAPGPVGVDTVANSGTSVAAITPRRIVERAAAPRIKRGATVFADVPDDDLAAEKVIGPKDSVNANELRRFLLSGLPAAQHFAVRPGRDTMLVGQQGTQLLVSADIWQLAPTDSSRVVELVLQEFYSPADMILAGLTTTAGPQLLETGGMLYLTATVDGRPVRLRAGQFLHLRMPTKAPQPDMRVFEGVTAGVDHRLDWQLPTAEAEPIDKPLVLQTGKGFKRRARHSPAHPPKRRWNLAIRPGPQEPLYDGGDRQLRKDLSLYVEYSDKTRAWLRRGRRMSHDDYLALRHASTRHKQRIVRIVTATFDIDTTGAAINPRFSAGTDERLKKNIAAAVAQLALWEPAQLRAGKEWQVASSDRSIVFYYPDAGPLIVEPREWSPKVAIERLNAIRSAKNAAARQARLLVEEPMRALWEHRADSLRALSKRYNDSLYAAQQERAAVERVRLRTQFTDTSTTDITEQGVYNELSTQRLKWINCDKFVARGPRITVGVDPGAPNAVVTLSFTRLRSIMSGDFIKGTGVLFPNIPDKQAATIVALRREKGVTFLATRHVQLSQQLLGGLVYRPVTMAELRVELAKL